MDNPMYERAEIDNAQPAWDSEFCTCENNGDYCPYCEQFFDPANQVRDDQDSEGNIDAKPLNAAQKLRILTDPTLTAKEALILSEAPLPQMAQAEREELEREAGRSLTNYQAHAYRMRKIRAQAVNDLLEHR